MLLEEKQRVFLMRPGQQVQSLNHLSSMFVFALSFIVQRHTIYFPAPSAAPEEIKLKDKSSTSITIMWSPVPCDHHNGNITEYVVMFRKLDNGVSQNESTRGSTMEYMISGLEPSTEYEIQVAAFTIAAGPFTNESLLASTLGTC